ncbi:MAG: universal stress protein [Chloroflexi bacterium]|nr:universal stress protein [Chloroflexota bacterium]
MFRKILVAVDGSKIAETALPYAEELCAKAGSELIFFRACDSREDCARPEVTAYMKELIGRVEDGVGRIKRQSAASIGKMATNVQFVLAPGNAAAQIIDYSASSGVGLIIIATHGVSGAGRWTLGAVAEKVLRGTRVPVALIPTDGAGEIPEKGVFGRALVPLDGSKTGEAALPYVEELAPRLGTEVILLQVVEHKYVPYATGAGGFIPYQQEWLDAAEKAARSYVASVEQKLKAKGITAKALVEQGAAADRIIEVAEKVGAHFIAMSTHGRSGVGRWVFGSVADRVLHSGKLPLVLVRASW